MFLGYISRSQGGLCLREVQQDEVWERQMPSVLLDLPPALAKEEIMNKYVAAFTLVPSLAVQKVEEGLKAPVSGAALAHFVFSPCLVLAQYGMA